MDMNLYLAGDDSLTLLRHARQSDDLMLVPALWPGDKDLCVESARFSEMLPADLLAPTPAHPLELRFPDAGSRCQSRLVRAHIGLAALPEGSYLEVLDAQGNPSPFSVNHGGHVYVESASLTLLSAARTLYGQVALGRLSTNSALIRLAALAMELCGIYARDPLEPATGQMAYDLPQIASVSEVALLLDQLGGSPGVKLARRAVTYANDGSGSAMETLWYFAFCLPPRLGGIHLERPLQNAPIEWPPGTRELACHERLRPDFHWPRYRRVCEYDSELHKSPRAFYEDRDRAEDYGLCELGYFPITDQDTASADAMLAFLRLFVRSIEGEEDDNFRRRMRRVLGDPQVNVARNLLRALLMPPTLRWREE